MHFNNPNVRLLNVSTINLKLIEKTLSHCPHNTVVCFCFEIAPLFCGALRFSPLYVTVKKRKQRRNVNEKRLKACNACVKRCGIIVVLQNDPLRTVPQPENKITRFKLGWGYFEILTCSYPSSTSDTSKTHTAGDCCRSNLTVSSPQLWSYFAKCLKLVTATK